MRQWISTYFPSELEWLISYIPDSAILLVVVAIIPIIIFSIVKYLKSIKEAFQWFFRFMFQPRNTLRQTFSPPATATSEEVTDVKRQVDKIERMLTKTADHATFSEINDPGQLGRSDRDRRREAAQQLVNDHSTEASAAVQALLEGNLDSAIAILEKDAETASDERAMRWRRLGDLTNGINPDVARKAYENAFALNPNDFWTCIRVAQRRRDTNDLAGTEQAVKTALEVAGTEREAAIARGEWADCLHQRGNLEAAAKSYRDCRDAFEHMLKQDPTSVEIRRSLANSLDRLSGVMWEAGHLDAAEHLYKRYVEIQENRARAHPTDENARIGLPIGLDRLGEMRYESSDLENAEAYFERARRIREVLKNENLENEYIRRGYAVSLVNLGMVFDKRGELQKAGSKYKEAEKNNGRHI